MTTETKNDSKHIQKALPEETIFVLLARDWSSPKIIAEWIKENLTTQPAEKLHNALDIAIKMAHEHGEILKAAEEKKAKDRQFKTDEEV